MRFIMDWGQPISVEDEHGKEWPIPRYMVWAERWEHVDGVPVFQRMKCIDTGVNLEELRKEYGDLVVHHAPRVIRNGRNGR